MEILKHKTILKKIGLKKKYDIRRMGWLLYVQIRLKEAEEKRKFSKFNNKKFSDEEKFEFYSDAIDINEE
jgi:hypothetical protein